MVDKPEIRSWVEQFVGALGVTGQFSFDFIQAADGEVFAIECNPRTHSAITMFHNHPQLASAYFEDGHPVITPLAGARPAYWIYHEVWRLLTQRGRRARLKSILRGQDAIFTWWDPLPYLMVHHLQIPALLIGNLRRRRGRLLGQLSHFAAPRWTTSTPASPVCTPALAWKRWLSLRATTRRSPTSRRTNHGVSQAN